jgi:hypothetical protein
MVCKFKTFNFKLNGTKLAFTTISCYRSTSPCIFLGQPTRFSVVMMGTMTQVKPAIFGIVLVTLFF